MKKILLFLAATLLLIPAFAQKYEPGQLKPGDYIIKSKTDGHLMKIDGGLRDDGFANKDMHVIKDRVVGVVSSVSGKTAVVIDIKDCPRKWAYAVVVSKDKTYQGNNTILPRNWPKQRKEETKLDWRLPTVSEAENINYKAVQHSLQQLVDAGLEGAALIHSGSDYWTDEYSRPDYPDAYAWYHYKGRIKTHLREPEAKLFVRAVFTFRE